MDFSMKNKYRFLSQDLDLLIKSAILAAENVGLEICGLLIYNGYFIEIKQCKNKSKKGGSFSFYQKEISSIERSVDILNHEIIGTFHSHPLSTAEPGPSDLDNAFDEEYMLIIDVMDQEAALWHIKNKAKKRVSFDLI